MYIQSVSTRLVSALLCSSFVLWMVWNTAVVSVAYGATVTARSGTRGDIIDAINRARSGDTVRIPGGSHSISSPIEVHKSIVLEGAGTKSEGTRLRSGNDIFRFKCSGSMKVEVSGITFVGKGGGSNTSNKGAGIELENGCKDFRIHHARFERFGHAGIVVRGRSRGVIDHNHFENIALWYKGKVNELLWLGYGVEVIGDGNKAWDRVPLFKLTLGTADVVFMEDNVFRRTKHSVAANNGAQYVFRHNLVDDTLRSGAGIDAHGWEAWEAGTRSYEIYNNTLTKGNWACMSIRGGDGVIWGNTCRGAQNTINMWNGDTGKNGQGSKCRYPCRHQTRDLYIWDNEPSGTLVNLIRGTDKIVKKDRDYHLKKKPGYTPYQYPHPVVRGNDHERTENTDNDRSEEDAVGGEETGTGTTVPDSPNPAPSGISSVPVPCNHITPGDRAPSGWGLPYSVYPNTRDMLMRGNCHTDTQKAELINQVPK